MVATAREWLTRNTAQAKYLGQRGSSFAAQNLPNGAKHALPPKVWDVDCVGGASLGLRVNPVLALKLASDEIRFHEHPIREASEMGKTRKNSFGGRGHPIRLVFMLDEIRTSGSEKHPIGKASMLPKIRAYTVLGCLK